MKSQIPISMTKAQNRFRISNFGHCDLFDICDLLFGISIPPVPQNSSPSLPAILAGGGNGVGEMSGL
jgi:hypothetical protein